MESKMRNCLLLTFCHFRDTQRLFECLCMCTCRSHVVEKTQNAIFNFPSKCILITDIYSQPFNLLLTRNLIKKSSEVETLKRKLVKLQVLSLKHDNLSWIFLSFSASTPRERKTLLNANVVNKMRKIFS